MFDGARNWKWMVPALLAPVLFVLQMWINDFAERSDSAYLLWCGCVSVPAMVIFAIQAVAGFRAYYHQMDTDQLVARRNALATTPEVRLFEMARMMHPEAVRLLLMHRKVVWRIKETPLVDLVDWVLDADPRIHVAFVEFVLRNSSRYALMAKRMLNDKSHSFDPGRLVTDYEQYDAFTTVLQRRGMLTEAFGNQPGQWIEPWNPDLVARQFGIVDLFEDEDGGLESAVQSK